MMYNDWINVEKRMPKEDEYSWVNIRKGDKEYDHPCKVCKVWEDVVGAVVFVNILFTKEKNVTHWRVGKLKTKAELEKKIAELEKLKAKIKELEE